MGNNMSLISTQEENLCSTSLKVFVRTFDSEKSKISLFLTRFEKQAKKAKVDISDWAMQLLNLLPMHLVESIRRLKENQ